MPETVIEPHIRRDILTRITPARSQELAIIRRQRRAERELARQAHLNDPEPVLNITDNEASRTRAKAIRLLEQHLAAVDEALTKAKTPADWRDLTSARERLFKQWVHLCNIPGPGNHKPTQSQSKPRPAQAEPIEPG